MADAQTKLPKAVPAKRGRKPGAGKAFRVTKFDKDLVKLIQSGVMRFSDWCQMLGVDETQARSRVNTLVEKGYLAPDAQLVGVYRLGIEGYNKYGSLRKAAGVALSVPSLPSAPTGLADVVLSRSAEREKPPVALPVVPSRPLPSSGVRCFDDDGAPSDVVPKARSEMDLAEMLQKGAPGGRLLKKDGSMCELCRGEFKVSVKEPKLARFAHCVCGAAYHQDCHQSLIDGGAGCVRCGRRLSTVLDQNSQDALKFVKDAFE